MILDASAFYAGVPFSSPEAYSTTPEVYGEVRHIKRSQRAAEALLEAGRLRVLQPPDSHLRRARAAALSSGDLPQLSASDMSVLALASQTGLDIITDDYAISNAAHAMGIRTHSVMTEGPATLGRWKYRCGSCRKARPPGLRCGVCGTPLRRRLHRATA